MNDKLALIVGNSDGIGLALTKRLLSIGWQVVGLSRSPSPIKDESYRHVVTDVASEDYGHQLKSVLELTPNLTVYCAGIGDEFSAESIEFEQRVFHVNLMGAVKTIEAVLPGLIRQRRGQIIVLSSLADEIVSAGAPSYSASKAGLSSYVEGIAWAVRKYGVSVTNVRFGFVDTKMAKGAPAPLKMTVAKAVDHILKCMRKQPLRYSRPRLMVVIVLLVRWATKIRSSFASGVPASS